MAEAPVYIGAVLLADQARIVFPTPRMIGRGRENTPLSVAAVQACPAVNTYASRSAEILSPFSMRLRCIKHKNSYAVRVVPDGTRLSDRLVNKFVNVMSRKQWRHEERPVIQVSIPWLFVCDEPC